MKNIILISLLFICQSSLLPNPAGKIRAIPPMQTLMKKY